MKRAKVHTGNFERESKTHKYLTPLQRHNVHMSNRNSDANISEHISYLVNNIMRNHPSVLY